MTLFDITDYIKKYIPINKQERTHMEIFFEFLRFKIFDDERFSVEDFSFINEDDLLESLVYYIERNRITSKQTAKAYVGNIKNFFKNLEEHYQINNSVYVNGNFISTFEREAAKIISKLNDTIDKEIATDDEYIEILQTINEVSKHYSFDEAKKGIDKYINIDKQNCLSEGPDMFRCIRSICATMLVLEYGLKNETIRDMKVYDINLTTNTIVRGRYKLQLSESLKKYFNEYLQIREYLLSGLGKHQDFLFISRNGDSFVGASDIASKLFTILSQNRGSVATTSLAKKSLIRMINNGFNSELIEEITGHKYSTYKKLCALINQDKEHVQVKLQSFMRDPKHQQDRTYKKRYINCPLCRKEVKAIDGELVLIKYPNDLNYYLACKKCGEKEKAKAGVKVNG